MEYIYATTSGARDVNKESILSRNIKNEIKPNRKIGIMFGRENCGLNNQEIAYANKIITIDTNINFSSMNIAQSIAVICYEIFQSYNQPRQIVDNKLKLAKMIELEYFYDHLFTELQKRNFFRVAKKKELMSNKIRNLFGRIDNLSQSELQILRGIVTVLSI